MTLEETDDFKQVYLDAMNELWDISIARIMNITDSIEIMFQAIEKDEKKILGDTLSQVIAQLLESHMAQKSYWALRERLLNYDETEQRTS